MYRLAWLFPGTPPPALYLPIRVEHVVPSPLRIRVVVA
jgi:hypothetical protein